MNQRARKTFAALVTAAFFCAVASLTMAAYAAQEPPAVPTINPPSSPNDRLSDAAWGSLGTMVGSVVAAIAAVIVALRTNRAPSADLTAGEAQTKLALEITRLNKIIDDYQETDRQATAKVNDILDEHSR